jgi:hypothetical protein
MMTLSRGLQGSHVEPAESPGKRTITEGSRSDGRDGETSSLSPGKRTLTESLVPASKPVAVAGEAGGGDPGVTSEADMIQEGSHGAAGGPGGPETSNASAVSGPGAAVAAGAAPAASPMPPAQPATGHAEGGGGASTGPAPGSPPPSATPAPAPAPAPATLVIVGPRELWYFDSATPAGYEVSKPIHSNRSGGTFVWSCSANLTLSATGVAAPTVTTAAASATARDAWIRVSHTDASGTVTAARYTLTIKAPSSLGHLSDVDNADATYAYMSYIHYSIKDQFGTILPRNVPINEQFTAAPTADFAGMDWRRGPAGAALVSPTDWADQVGGEVTGHTPTALAPGSAGAATAVCHWPGVWRAGSMTIGSGRQVKSVTWSKSRGFARHT